MKDSHDRCPELSARAAAQDARTAAALERGESLRVSALTHSRPADAVRVIFRDSCGRQHGADMTHATYDALPLLEPVTLEDFRAAARMLEQPEPTDAPATFAGL